VKGVVSVPGADLRAGYLFPHRPEIQVVVAVWFVNPEEHVPRYRIAIPLHRPEIGIEALPLSDGPVLALIEALVCGDFEVLGPLWFVYPYV
jgi:hypothetical protein